MLTDQAYTAGVNRWFSRKLPRQWLRLLTGVLCLAVWQMWLTARLLEQDQNLEQPNAREDLGQIADLTVAQLSGSLADWELGLHELNSLPPSSWLGFPNKAGEGNREPLDFRVHKMEFRQCGVGRHTFIYFLEEYAFACGSSERLYLA